jgi:hypothetical protein
MRALIKDVDADYQVPAAQIADRPQRIDIESIATTVSQAVNGMDDISVELDVSRERSFLRVRAYRHKVAE